MGHSSTSPVGPVQNVTVAGVTVLASTASRQPRVTSHVVRSTICRAGLASPPAGGRGGEGSALTLLCKEAVVQLLEREKLLWKNFLRRGRVEEAWSYSSIFTDASAIKALNNPPLL